jgi:hypothetical protein
MQFTPASCHFLPVRYKYSPQHPVLKQPCSSFSVREYISHPHKTTDKIIVLYILILKFCIISTHNTPKTKPAYFSVLPKVNFPYFAILPSYMRRGGLHTNSLRLSCLLSCSKSDFCSVVKVNIMSYPLRFGLVLSVPWNHSYSQITVQKSVIKNSSFLRLSQGLQLCNFSHVFYMTHPSHHPSKYQTQSFWLLMSVVWDGGISDIC